MVCLDCSASSRPGIVIFADSPKALDYLEIKYIYWNTNLLCAFLQRGWDWSRLSGSVGLIYDRTAIVKSTYEDFRRHSLVSDERIFTMADLGWDVLDANVEVTTSVLHHTQTPGSGLFTDLRTVPTEKKRKY